MSDELADLVRDAASLHRFISSVCKPHEEQERTRRPATVTFLNYIRELGKNAESYLQSFVSRVAETPNDLGLNRFERQRLTTIRDFWSSLHELVRPAEDAHTLSIPVAFIEFLERSLSAIPGLESCDVVLCHTSKLNYYFRPRAGLRYYAQRYEAIIGGAPSFPQKLALIEMPYSQGTSLFLNLVICHELGHFAFEELGLEQKLTPEIDSALRTIPNFANLLEPDLSWCRERLKYWSEEIFCDRFALGLIGPAYTFAYIELLDVIGTSDSVGSIMFYDSHPAEACRFREHAAQLQDGGWWELLDESSRTSYVTLIKELATIPESNYEYSSEEKSQFAKPVLEAFLKLKPTIAILVAETLGDQLRRFRTILDREEIRLVRTYLSHGIVPSTLIQEGKRRSPDAIALINAAYLFYLESLPDLMRKIANQDENRMAHRSKWAERVEMWTLKAIEDLSLLSSQEENIHGGFIAKLNC